MQRLEGVLCSSNLLLAATSFGESMKCDKNQLTLHIIHVHVIA